MVGNLFVKFFDFVLKDFFIFMAFAGRWTCFLFPATQEVYIWFNGLCFFFAVRYSIKCSGYSLLEYKLLTNLPIKKLGCFKN